jgi:hypothetical protein
MHGSVESEELGFYVLLVSINIILSREEEIAGRISRIFGKGFS